MGSRRVTQETFDAAVRENVEEFELEPEEALAAAVQQFQSQGVDLSNIVKTAPKAAAGAPEPQHDVLQALDALRESVAGSRAPEAAAHLARFREQCARHRGGRFLAAERGAYPVVLAAGELGAAGGDHGLLLQALDALAALTDGQPGLLDAAGLWLLADALALHGDAAELTRAALRCVRHACLRHEGNRRALAGAGVLPLLTGAVARHGRHAGVVTEACGALRALTCDDDARVPFGHGHDHARKIVQEHGGLRVLLDATRAFPDDPGVLGELCGTLSRLAVRNEFCRELVELGGLGVLLRLLAERADHQDLVRQVLSALRAVAGNDDVKDAIVRAGGAEAIVAAMVRHLASPQVCEQSCAALSILALRKPEHSRVIVESGGAQAALRAMRAHPREAAVQKQACMLIRNVVARSQALSQPLLELGAEALVAQARAAHPDCEDAAKAALRDLGCRVELREPWTGQKGDLAP